MARKERITPEERLREIDAIRRGIPFDADKDEETKEVPQFVIAALAEELLKAMRGRFDDPNIQRDFLAWKAERKAKGIQGDKDFRALNSLFVNTLWEMGKYMESKRIGKAMARVETGFFDGIDEDRITKLSLGQFIGMTTSAGYPPQGKAKARP